LALIFKLRYKPSEIKINAKNCLSTGSTLLNLAITGNPEWGYLKGHYYSFTGDTRSGKTWLALCSLAEAAKNPHFKEYRLIHDDVEHGALMNKERFFGKKLMSRIEAPDGGNSYLLEDFYFNVQDAINDGRPFVYVLDSMDSLSSEQEVEKFQERKKARENDKDISGTMTDGKAKINSQDLRQLLTPLYKSKSILITIHQTRQRMGLGAKFSPKTRGGGEAPGFYVGIELWSKVVGTIKKTVRNKPRQIGTLCEVQTKKNRLQGKDRKVIIPILWSVGVDDIGACVDYLVDEGRWNKKKNQIDAVDLDVVLGREQLIHHIERKNLERDVKEYVTDVWEEVEEASAPKRKARYE